MKKPTQTNEQLVRTFQTTSSTHSFDTLYQRYVGKVYWTFKDNADEDQLRLQHRPRHSFTMKNGVDIQGE